MADQALNTINYAALRPRTMRTGRSEWLQAWLNGDAPDQMTLEQQGFQPNQYYAIVIYQPASDAATGAQFASMLHIEATRRRIALGPTLAHGDVAVCFHPIENPQQTMALKRQTQEIREQLVNRLQGADVCCGVGRPARGIENLRQSFHEAEDALRLCSEFQTESRSTFFGNSSLYGLLLSLKSPNELTRFCMTWLAELIDYDAQQHSDLLETLKTYFANNGNTALTAMELKIHRNTLAYRLNRIAEITRLDLDDADVRLNLHLAIKAREVLSTGRLQ